MGGNERDLINQNKNTKVNSALEKLFSVLMTLFSSSVEASYQLHYAYVYLPTLSDILIKLNSYSLKTGLW